MARRQLIRPIRDVVARLRGYVGGNGGLDVYTGCSLYSPRQFRAALEREQARAERNGHQIALAIVPAGSRDDGAAHLAQALKSRLRVTDEAGWFDQSRIGVLMPYTSCTGAWHMIEDLYRLVDGVLPLQDCRVYTYPCDRPGGPDGHRGHGEAESCAAERACWPAASASATVHPWGCPSESDARARCPWATISMGLVSAYPPGSGPWIGMPFWQRGLDIMGALLGLIFLSPVFLGAALLIKLVSPGPVFFKQMRIGQGARPFLLWKFRTMTVDADASVHRNHMARLICGTAENGRAGAKPMTKLNDDPRVIPLGRILRGTCIDELPQLINVLRGEMSLVGPRPPILYEVEDYLPWQRRRLDTVPGLTGLWQVSGKNKLTFEEMVRLDIRYGRAKSIWMNILIILRTPRAIAREIADVWGRPRTETGVSDHA
jgi:lipopolysaccharide/colanic/teichoic acid biosynthesis glycosyltransferase